MRRRRLEPARHPRACGRAPRPPRGRAPRRRGAPRASPAPTRPRSPRARDGGWACAWRRASSTTGSSRLRPRRPEPVVEQDEPLVRPLDDLALQRGDAGQPGRHLRVVGAGRRRAARTASASSRRVSGPSASAARIAGGASGAPPQLRDPPRALLQPDRARAARPSSARPRPGSGAACRASPTCARPSAPRTARPRPRRACCPAAARGCRGGRPPRPAPASPRPPATVSATL